jgi:hypothetical protein
MYERSPPDSRSSPHDDASSSPLYRCSITLAVCSLARALCWWSLVTSQVRCVRHRMNEYSHAVPLS